MRTMTHLRHYPTWSILLCVVLCGSFALANTARRQERPKQEPESATPTVEITRFQPAISQGELRLFKLSFRYDFPKRTRVVIVGFGEVPAKGSLTYLTPNRSLVFKDTNGTTLKRVELKRTGTPEGAASRMPAPGDFPPEIKSYSRSGILSREQCDAVLNQFFESGYLPTIEQNLTVYTTTYQNMPNPPQGKVARYALRITSPFPSDTAGKSSFHVQLAVQEQGILSPKPAQTVSPTTTKAANDLRDEIVKRLSQ